MSPEIANRRDEILAVIDEYGSQKAFAEAIGFGESRISRALDPEKATDRRLAPIERAIARLRKGESGDGSSGNEGDVSIPGTHDWDIDSADPSEITRALMRIGKEAGALAERLEESYLLHIYLDTAAAAGEGTVIFEPERRVTIPVPKEIIRALVGFNPPDAMIAFFCRGRSMLPTFPDGTLLFIDPNDRGDLPGRYVILKNGKPPELITKKVSPILSGGFTLVSDNQLEGYPNETYKPLDDPDEADAPLVVNVLTGDRVDLRIAGRVLWPRSLPDMARVDEVALLFRSFFTGAANTLHDRGL